MTISEAWGYGEWKNSFPDTFKDLGFAPPPTPSGKPEPYYGRQNAVLSLSVLKGRPTEETNAAFKFISYLINERIDTQYELAAIAGLVPAHADLLKDPKVTQDPFTSMAAQVVAKEYDAVEVGDPLNKVLADAMGRMILEKQTIPETLKTAQVALQKVLADGELKYLRG
jgi:ABC-type glycerol-3-phosphate transport system substrate-binding protein